MKRGMAVTVVVAAIFSLLSCAKTGDTAGKTSLKDFTEKSSYALGMDFGSYVKGMPVDIDLASLLQGLKDTVEERECLLTQEEMSTVMMEFQQKVQEEGAKKRDGLSKTNIEEGRKFLEANKTADGVVTTESGLQYTVITEGDGPKPKATDVVSVHYLGTLLDGTEFDSSYKRGEPAGFQLDKVIPGWTEGVQLMSVGSKYRFFIPSELAYGERGGGQIIGPNATLIFEVELLSIGE
ncbi:MAG: FKBP-type peptidyl-prolyl cis-trans isomerase [Candidatus Eisenbacteria sp.]|nr:FKBP-type peptidyl-prolyl cis-trans isomerase [Candidatus Eisenbacteria bacterium]